MKKIAFCLIILVSLSWVMSCTRRVQLIDPFYNLNRNDFPIDHLPLINPIEATREMPSSPWRLDLLNVLWIDLPNNNVEYPYSHIEELKKIAVKNGVIMAYSSYVDQQADAYIQNNYYHWFVMVPKKNITAGFHTEDEFDQYIQKLGIQNPDWQTPNEAFDKFAETGCLVWIPDCNQ